MSGHDKTGPVPMRMAARVEEQYDDEGDLIWTLMLALTTHDRRGLDWVADRLGCELEFVPIARAAS